MRILVLSDNHRRSLEFDFSGFDYVIHAGDRGDMTPLLDSIKAYYVCGNCDFSGNDSLAFNLYNRKIFLTHGNIYNVKFTKLRLIYKAMEEECSACIFGHTHIPECFIENGILFLNPGAYKDGYYAIIEDEKITIYLKDEVFKTIDFRW